MLNFNCFLLILCPTLLNLNTSNVKLQPGARLCISPIVLHLNTSNVKLQQNDTIFEKL